MYLDEIDIFTEEGMQVDKSFSTERNFIPLVSQLSLHDYGDHIEEMVERGEYPIRKAFQ